MKTTFLLLSLFFSLNLQAQKVQRSGVIGTWTAISGEISTKGLDAEQKQMMSIMIDGFKNSKWTFQEDGIFRLKLQEPVSPTMKELNMLDNKQWVFNEEKQELRTGTKKEITTISFFICSKSVQP